MVTLGFIFNGVRKSYTELLHVQVDKVAPIQRQLFEVPGLPGAHMNKTKTLVRKIKVILDLSSYDHESLLLLIEDLVEWLVTDIPKELIFDREPSRRYYAILDGEISDRLLNTYGQLEINFICPDPYKYGPNTPYDFVDGQVTIINNGSVPTSPVFEVQVLGDLTYLDVFNGDGYMRIGNPEEPDKTAPPALTRVLNDEMADLTAWSADGSTLTGDAIAGNFAIFGGYEAYVGSYGTGTGWHGPAIKRSIPQAPLTDFQVELQFKFPSPGSGYFGKTELYILDDQSQRVGKISMKKVKGGSQGNHVEVTIGPATQAKLIIDYKGDTGREWDNFDGIIRLIRKGNVWESYVAQISATGVHHSRHFRRYTDSANLYMGNVSQLMLHMAQYGTSPVPGMRIKGIHVNRINDVSLEEPYIFASAGDYITFDHKRSELLVNGEDAKELKDFGAHFFKLPKGPNTISIEPRDKVAGTVKIEEAYL